MSERDTQISRDVSVDVESGLEDSVGTPESEQSSGGVRSRLRERADSLVSARSVVIALVLMLASTFVFGAIPLLGMFGELLGIVVAGFVYGLGTDARRYFELALAGALAGGGSVLLGNFLIALLGSGLTIVGFGAVGGAVAGIVGHYFGRDLRHGLTQDLGEGP
jgi:hypothetical protein